MKNGRGAEGKPYTADSDARTGAGGKMVRDVAPSGT